MYIACANIHLKTFFSFLVNKLTKQLVLVNSEKAQVDKELDELRQKFRDLKQKNEKLVLDSEGHVTQEDHINKMTDLKRFVTFIMHNA